MTMSRARFNAVMSGMTTTAKKVYEVVPITDQWTALQISSELRRNNVSLDFNLVGGCLNSLIKSGLVTEPTTGRFMREPIKEQKPNKEPEMPKITAATPILTKPTAAAIKPAAKAINPMDRIGELAQRAALMSVSIKELADDISDAAVDIQAQMEANEESNKKMRQLQTLLKSLSLETEG